MLTNRKARRAALKEAARVESTPTEITKKLVAQAGQSYANGNFREAATFLRKAIRVDSSSAEIHSSLGAILDRLGESDEALSANRRAITLAPNQATHYYNFGISLSRTGLLSQAADAHRRAIVLAPNDAGACSKLAVILDQLERLDEAIYYHNKSIEIDGNCPDSYIALGNTLSKNHLFSEAVNAYDLAIKFNKRHPEALLNLGITLIRLRKFNNAVSTLRSAINYYPSFWQAHLNLGSALKSAGNLDDAISSFREAIKLQPGYAENWYNFGNCLEEKDRFFDAIICYKNAISLNTEILPAYVNLSNAQKALGQLKNAIYSGVRAIAIKPNEPDAHFNLSTSLLLNGDFSQGWKEHEWRWQRPGTAHEKMRQYSQPLWSGEKSHEETTSILLWAEQGFGDFFQFIRYIPLIQKLGWKIIIEAPKPLKRLLSQSDIARTTEIFIKGETLPNFDCHCPLMSIPHRMGTTINSIPANIPYLSADSEQVAAWCHRLADRQGFKVGIAWRGNPSHKNDHHRSMEPTQLARLFDLPGLSVVSLQKDGRPDEIDALGAGDTFLDAGPDLADFADTAAVIANLDLVISADTSVCHLAGALGVPTWTLVPFSPDWRWLTNRQDSPWYPTMRLFRQPAVGDWQSVIADVHTELCHLVKAS